MKWEAAIHVRHLRPTRMIQNTERYQILEYRQRYFLVYNIGCRTCKHLLQDFSKLNMPIGWGFPSRSSSGRDKDYFPW